MTACYPGLQSKFKKFFHTYVLFLRMSRITSMFRSFSALNPFFFFSEFRISGKEGGHDRIEYSLLFCGIFKEKM